MCAGRESPCRARHWLGLVVRLSVTAGGLTRKHLRGGSLRMRRGFCHTLSASVADPCGCGVGVRVVRVTGMREGEPVRGKP